MMLEAVNSVLQNAPLVRGNVEQVSTSDSFAANPERIQRSAPQAPFVSPFIVVDVNYDKAIIQLRNGDTGDVEEQFPSEASLQASAKQAARQQVNSESLSSQTQPQSVSQGETSAKIETDKTQSISTQQLAAFQAASQSGNSNAGNITVFA